MFFQQRWFDYRDKSGKFLANLLADRSLQKSVRMQKKDGTMTYEVLEKLALLEEYYVTLYLSAAATNQEMQGFLKTYTLRN